MSKQHSFMDDGKIGDIKNNPFLNPPKDSDESPPKDSESSPSDEPTQEVSETPSEQRDIFQYKLPKEYKLEKKYIINPDIMKYENDFLKKPKGLEDILRFDSDEKKIIKNEYPLYKGDDW